MPIKDSGLTSTDQFSGCGGDGQALQAEGVEVKVAINHWEIATQTYGANFPRAIIDCTDISACDPRRYPSTDMLVTSPECTNHSIARGKKVTQRQMDLFASGKLDPAAERSRATMWDVPRFAEYHNYNIIILENVVDARKWVMFDAWLSAMYSLGYLHECSYFNSMHFHPTPQSRDRMYITFWKKGNKPPDLNYTPLAHCNKCCKDVESVQTWKNPKIRFGKYRQQYLYCCPGCGLVVEPYYYASFNCIDWNDKGHRIGDRKRPLADNSVFRIKYGIDKYNASPFRVNASDGAFKITSFPGIDFSLGSMPSPFIVENKGGSTARSITDAFATQTTKKYLGLITTDPFHSFITAFYNGSNCTKHITEAVGTMTAKARHALVNYQQPNIEDCYYRMLKKPEIQKAMAFADDYIILGNEEEQVKQLGNAVTPPAMRYLVRQAVKSLS
jgi:DNA (cytosine-5)-methyltransferase 1